MPSISVDRTALRSAASGLRATADGLAQLRAVDPVATGDAGCDVLLARCRDRTALQLSALASECSAGADAARVAAGHYDVLEAR